MNKLEVKPRALGQLQKADLLLWKCSVVSLHPWAFPFKCDS